MSRYCAASLLMFTCVLPLAAAPPEPTPQTLARTVAVNLGEARDFEKSDAPVANPPPGRDALLQQARRCRHILKTSLVDFYLPVCVDQINGGFLESLRGGRFTPTGEKFLTMQGRQLWFFSVLACEGAEQKAALAAAKSGFDFLESRMRDRRHGGYFAKVTDTGQPTDRRKHVYLNAFALYGLVAYHRATHDAQALAAAQDLFRVLEAKAHDRKNGGYVEFFYEDWQPINDPKEPGYVGAIGTKTYNTHVHVLEALTDLYRVWPDALVGRRLAELVAINTNTVRNPKFHCNIDGWQPDWRMVETPGNPRASYGHDVECAWLTLDAARALGLSPRLLQSWAEALCAYSLKFGYDREHGGFYYTGPLGQPAEDTRKEWWVQAEALVSMLEMYRLTGKQEYYDAFCQTLDFVEKHQVAPQGGWWATRMADGAPKDNHRSSPWQGAYHSGRAMLLCAKLLEGLADARAEASPMPSLLKVVKTQLHNDRNERVRLRGVNTASLEWSSNGEGHILDTLKTAIQDWHASVIRLPLAQDRWFGKAPDQMDNGKAYRALVKGAVDTCAARGCYVVLDLHWSDAGEWGKQIGQHVMPDQNSLTLWKDLAKTYKNHPAVLFDLYNEPHNVSWDIWRDGGKVTEKNRRTGKETTYEAVGMQALLDAVRGTGAKNVVIAGGLDWAYDLSGILAGKQLSDPNGHGVIYANHAYPNKGDTVEKWVAKMETATKSIPVIVSEFGSESRGAAGSRGERWVRQVLQALHDRDWDWIAWDLHPRAGPRLVSDWDYTPTPSFGKWVKQALLGTFEPYAPPASLTAPPQADGARAQEAALPIGIFNDHGDVGTVLHPGSGTFDVATANYTVAGSGENMWFAKDAFHFLWKKTSGDLSLTADISFLGPGAEPHRKACLMIRQSLDADAAYADVALHGDGLTSLQFREAKGAATHEVQANISNPVRLRIERRGKYTLMYLAAKGEEMRFSGAAARLHLEEPFYVGIGVCAHNKDVTEKAVFSNVELTTGSPPSARRPALYSALETQMIASKDRRVVYVTPTRIEAPNWLRDGSKLIFNSGGRIQRISTIGGNPETIDTGFATRCNNDHGVSPDGTLLAISDQSQGKRQSLIYTLPISGGTPRLVTPSGPSYWHGWSPDGKTIAFCGERNGEFDIYTIPAEGGQERRLTTAKGLDDGPEYSPDGRYIYFNSERTGRMQIWRMKPDGSEQEQVTSDKQNNWFPHVSPNGRYVVFLSYEKDVSGHPENKDVTLRMMSLDSKMIDVLGRFFGGQGTINVPCWSPDSRRIAFVTYQLIP